MALYRLDFIGSTDPIKNGIGQEFLSHHASTARARAIDAAAERGLPVTINRIGNTGAIRPTLVIHPDGRATRPDGMSGEDCTAGPGQPACFCRNCRAGRRKS
jgi:hypothetical protein